MISDFVMPKPHFGAISQDRAGLSMVDRPRSFARGLIVAVPLAVLFWGALAWLILG